MKIYHPLVVRLFTAFWKHRLNVENREQVVFVTGWRSCVIDDKWGGRKGVWFCGWYGS